MGCRWLINQRWVKQLRGEAAVATAQRRRRSNERLTVSHINTQTGEQTSRGTESRSPQAAARAGGTASPCSGSSAATRALGTRSSCSRRSHTQVFCPTAAQSPPRGEQRGGLGSLLGKLRQPQTSLLGGPGASPVCRRGADTTQTRSVSCTDSPPSSPGEVEAEAAGRDTWGDGTHGESPLGLHWDRDRSWGPSFPAPALAGSATERILGLVYLLLRLWVQPARGAGGTGSPRAP